MTIKTKYDIGQLLSWRIGGKPLIVNSIKVLSETSCQYICSYSDADGLPKECTFVESELEPWNNKPIGFTKYETRM